MPILHDGQIVGAIGVSGASSAPEDHELSVVGARAAGTTNGGTSPAVRLSAAEVSHTFEDGGLLMDTLRFQLDAARRTGPGGRECHESATDIMRVVEGRATVVTGNNGEGMTHELGPGDVLVIPEGVPHEFTSASDPFLYFVVKVEA
jgi:glc operon protein GlcG